MRPSWNRIAAVALLSSPLLFSCHAAPDDRRQQDVTSIQQALRGDQLTSISLPPAAQCPAGTNGTSLAVMPDPRTPNKLDLVVSCIPGNKLFLVDASATPPVLVDTIITDTSA